MPELTAEQLAARRHGIGASDIAAIAGLAFRKTAWDVLLEKRGLLAPTSNPYEDEAKEIGHELEEWMAAWFTRKSGLALLPGGMVYHPDKPYAFATIDRKIIGLDELLEIKIVGGMMMFNWHPTERDGVPDEVHCQCAWQMHVMPRIKRVHVAANVGGTSRRLYTLERDDELIDRLDGLASAFWTTVADPALPPLPLDSSDACRAYLEQKYPRDTRPRREATEEEEIIATRRAIAARDQKACEQVKKLADAQLLAACKEDAGLIGRGWSVSNRIPPRSKTGERHYRFSAKKGGPLSRGLDDEGESEVAE